MYVDSRVTVYTAGRTPWDVPKESKRTTENWVPRGSLAEHVTVMKDDHDRTCRILYSPMQR